MRRCHYCKKPNGPGPAELRPYGPGGSDICFACATATPERENAAKGAFGALLDANEIPTGVVVLTQDGPEPFTPPASDDTNGKDD